MEIKQVIVVRKDLNMRKGKMVAQGAHASVLAVLGEWKETDSESSPSAECFCSTLDPDLKKWLFGDYKKICVGVQSEEELLSVFNLAKEKSLRRALVQDHGLTEFGGVPTFTAVAIGPAPASLVDEITGGLELL